PWCGPCRVLGPILERLAEEHAGRFLLAKVNVDENPGLAHAFQVRGIPTVHAVVNGKVVDSFTGALPEIQVRAWLEGILPGPGVEQLERDVAMLVKDVRSRAKQILGELLERKPCHGDALLRMARIPAAGGKVDVAERSLVLIRPDDAERLEKEIAVLRLKLSG